MLLIVGVSQDCYRICRSCLLPAMFALAACSSSASIEQQSKMAASASQTAAMVVDAWVAGAAPSDYASATLESTAEMLAEAGRQAQPDNSLQSPERRRILAAIDRLSAAARRAQASVEADNSRQVSQARQELRAGAADLAAAYAKYVASK